MHSESHTIILCAGKPKYRAVEGSPAQSNSMIPINGKPVIGWILDDLLEKNIREATVVLNPGDSHLLSFIERSYSGRMGLHYAFSGDESTILHSLLSGLQRVSRSGLVRMILGDTLITEPYTGDTDFVYTGDVEDSRRWCLVKVNNKNVITQYFDKKENMKGKYKAIAGYYHLQDSQLLHSCLMKTLAEEQRELSEVLKKYSAERPISAVPLTNWYDFGHFDKLAEARQRLLKSRSFNTLAVDPILNTIIKRSKNSEKLAEEVEWYSRIPERLKVLTPRIVETRKVNGSIEIIQEYYGYPALAELYVYGDLHINLWQSILRKLMHIHAEFRKYPGTVKKEHLTAMYWDKLWERIESLKTQSDFWKDLLERKRIRINGDYHPGLAETGGRIKELVLKMDCPNGCVIHGDYCFSNILYDINNQIVRLIDPRGSFGVKGIYGDPRYDMAKLRHSVSGLYDFIVSDNFEIREHNGEFTTRIHAGSTPGKVTESFDGLLEAHGYRVEEIKFLEALLFLSMTPLHSDNLNRQKMMFLRGITLLSEVI